MDYLDSFGAIRTIIYIVYVLHPLTLLELLELHATLPFNFCTSVPLLQSYWNYQPKIKVLMRTPRTPRARYCQRSGTSQPIPPPVPPLTTPSGPCLRSTTLAMRRSWSINTTGPSDRWIMHGQRSNQCMGRLIGLTRPTAIVINKEARIQCFYRMSVVNCSQLYKSR